MCKEIGTGGAGPPDRQAAEHISSQDSKADKTHNRAEDLQTAKAILHVKHYFGDSSIDLRVDRSTSYSSLVTTFTE
jgi:hypothetical protein